MSLADTTSREEDFYAYYDAKIAPDLVQLEGRRKQMAFAIKGLWGLCVLGFALFLLSGMIAPLLGLSSQTLVVGGFVCVFGGAGGAILLRRLAAAPFKRVLVGRTCGFMGLDYSRTGDDFPFDIVRGADVTEEFHSGKVRDRIRGSYKGVGIALAEAVLRSTRKRGNETKTFDSFRGLLIVYSFPRAFDGHTIVRPDATWLGNKIVGMRREAEQIALEDPHFESQFEVYGDDPVEARALLTPLFMERIVGLAQKLNAEQGGNHHLAMSFTGPNLVVAIRSDTDFFEGGSVLKQADDKARAEELMAELGMIHDVVDVLELGTDEPEASHP